MPGEFFPGLRKKLSSVVDGAWVGQIEAKHTLRKAAEDTGYASCLKDLMLRGVAGRDAYRECQEKTNLAGAYRGIWGTT